MLDGFIRTLNELIEGAKTRVRDPDEFLATNEQIKTLIETELPPLAEAISAGELGADARARLEHSLAALGDLEAKVGARLVWAGDFEDYMREALSRDDQ
ncbi:MAG: hypothetical protein CMN41_05360 [SAR116 cluster bacterium]|nr:hypothetical protein [SAR116 cluster bacterium]